MNRKHSYKRKLIPKSTLMQKEMALHRLGSVFHIPDEVIFLIKEFMFHDFDNYLLHWNYQYSMHLCSWNRNMNNDNIYVFYTISDYSTVEMVHWSYRCQTKENYIQIKCIMCSMCGNYYDKTSPSFRNQVGFTEKIWCRCEFDLEYDEYESDGNYSDGDY